MIPIIFAAFFSFLPESPYYLIFKNREEDARKSLKKFRNHNYNIDSDISNMKADIEFQKSQKTTFIEALKRRTTINGLVISLGLVTLAQFCGLNVVIFYAKLIFDVG